LKFGDVVTAVASLAVIAVLFMFPLGLALIPALGFYSGQNVTAIVSIFLSALICGYIFAEKIQVESRKEAIAKIAVLAAVLMMFNIGISAAVFADWTQMAKDMYLEANPGVNPGELSTFDWWVVVSGVTGQVIFWNVVIVLVLVFIGLYAGSMLRRPAKS